MIMVILIAVLGLVVVNAMKHSAWATSTVAATVPIAMIVGIYMTHLRPGRLRRRLGARRRADRNSRFSAAATVEGWSIGHYFVMEAPGLAVWIIAYGFLASGPADFGCLLAPRDYLSAFHQDRNDHRARTRHRRDASARPHAAAHPVHQRTRPRSSVARSFRSRSSRFGMRCNLRLPFADSRSGTTPKMLEHEARRALDRITARC